MNYFDLFRLEGVEPLPHAADDYGCQALVLGWMLAYPGINNDLEWLLAECEHFSISENDALSAVCTGFAEWYGVLEHHTPASAKPKLRRMLQTYERLLLAFLQGSITRDDANSPVKALPALRMLLEHMEQGAGKDEQQMMFDSFVERVMTVERLNHTVQLVLQFDEALNNESETGSSEQENLAAELETDLNSYFNAVLAGGLQDPASLEAIFQRLYYAIRNLCKPTLEELQTIASTLTSFNETIIPQ